MAAEEDRGVENRKMVQEDKGAIESASEEDDTGSEESVKAELDISKERQPLHAREEQAGCDRDGVGNDDREKKRFADGNIVARRHRCNRA